MWSRSGGALPYCTVMLFLRHHQKISRILSIFHSVFFSLFELIFALFLLRAAYTVTMHCASLPHCSHGSIGVELEHFSGRRHRQLFSSRITSIPRPLTEAWVPGMVVMTTGRERRERERYQPENVL